MSHTKETARFQMVRLQGAACIHQMTIIMKAWISEQSSWPYLRTADSVQN